MRKPLFYVLLILALSTPFSVRSKTLYLSSFEGDKVAMCEAAAEGARVNAFELATYCQYLSVDVNAYIIEKNLSFGLKGMCSSESNVLREAAGLDLAPPQDCLDALLATDSLDFGRDVFHVMVSSYKRTLGTPEAAEWREIFNEELDKFYSKTNYITWSEESLDLMDSNLTQDLLTHPVISQYKYVGRHFYNKADSPSHLVCSLRARDRKMQYSLLTDFKKKCGEPSKYQ